MKLLRPVGFKSLASHTFDLPYHLYVERCADGKGFPQPWLCDSLVNIDKLGGLGINTHLAKAVRIQVCMRGDEMQAVMRLGRRFRAKSNMKG